MSTPASPLPRKPRKKLGKPRTSIEIEPGWVEDEPPITQVEPQGPGQQYPDMLESKRKARKLQRT